MELKTLAWLLTIGATACVAHKASARYRLAGNDARRSSPTTTRLAGRPENDTASVPSLGPRPVNPAEQLHAQAHGLGQSIGGSGAPDEPGLPGEHLLSSSSAQGSGPIAPGLPDVTRGA